MKKSLFYLLMLICSVSLFTACNDDDDNTKGGGEGLTIENSVIGTYGGTLNIKMNGSDLTPDGIQQKIYITKSSTKDAVALSLKDFSFGTFVLGDINVDPCPVVKDQKTFTFSGQKTLSFPSAPVLGACPVSVSGTVVDGNISATINVDVPTLSQVVVVVFRGDKIENEELIFNFDDWEVVKSATSGSTEKYNVPTGNYGTSNPGLLTINDMIGPNGLATYEYPVTSVAGRTGGKAAQIKTIHTAIVTEDGTDFNAALGGMLPYNTAGSLFTGSFWNDLSQMLSNPLNCTKFGIPVEGKPVTFSGYYKYAPGNVYYNEQNEEVKGKLDECSIYAVVYEEFTIKDKKGNDILGWLNGDWKNQESEDANLADRYIGSSSRIVMKAVVADGSARADWTQFSVNFETVSGKTYDPSKKYYLAIVCSSSAEGDHYKGGDGSTLIVDDFKVTVNF